LNHPVKFYSTLTPGSVVLDFDGLRLDAKFISYNGSIDDSFTLLKGDQLDAPELNIVRVGGQAIITWPATPPGFELQSKTTLDDSPWLPMNTGITTDGDRKSVTIPATAERQFFRLKSIP